MKQHLLFLVLVLVFPLGNILAQVEDESCLEPSKKVLKLIEAGNNAPDAKTAVDNFNAAIAAAPDNAMAFFEYGRSEERL